MSAVRHVVLTGGACSGKTSVVAELAARFRVHGARVAVAEEAASRVIGDVAPDIGSMPTEKYAAVQATMVRHARDQRRNLGRLVAELGGGVVLHDRGELDSLAYAPELSLERILAEVGEDPSDLVAAYQVVLVCASPPLGRYETTSNVLRYEDEQLAAERAAATRVVWAERFPVLDVAWCDDVGVKAAVAWRCLIAAGVMTGLPGWSPVAR